MHKQLGFFLFSSVQIYLKFGFIAINRGFYLRIFFQKIIQGNEAIAKLLIENGADIDKVRVN